MSTGAAVTVVDHTARVFPLGYPSGVLVTLTQAQQAAVDAIRTAQRELEDANRAARNALRNRNKVLREHADAIRSMSDSSPWADFEGALGADEVTGRPVLDRDTIRKAIGNT